MPISKSEALVRLARRGPVRARDLRAADIPRVYLQRLSDAGILERVDRGLYRLADAPVTELNSLAEVARRVPHATVCLLSALQIHALTTEVPHSVWIMIERKARVPKQRYPKLEVVRASGAARTHGVEVRVIAGTRVPITTAAKTVADCFRYRRRVGLDVALSALRDYLAKPRAKAKRVDQRRSIDALIAAARADRTYPLMRPYIEALV